MLVGDGAEPFAPVRHPTTTNASASISGERSWGDEWVLVMSHYDHTFHRRVEDAAIANRFS